MARLALIIEFGRTLRAGVFKPGGTAVEFFEAPLDDGAASAIDSLSRELRLKGFSGFSMILSSLPPQDVSMRLLDLPLADKKKLNAVLPFVTEDLFVGRTDDLALAGFPIGDGRSVAAAVGRAALRSHIATLKAAGLEPDWVGQSLFSKHLLLREGYDGPGVVALVDGESVVVKEGELRFLKNVRDASMLGLALSALGEDGVEVKAFYATDKGAEMLSQLGIESTPAAGPEIDGNIRNIEDGKVGLFALASQWDKGLRDTVNFRRGEFAHTKESERAAKSLKAAGVLLAALCVAWGAYSYVRYRNLNFALTGLKGGIEASYRAMFPQETHATGAGFLLEAKIKELKDVKKIAIEGVDVLDAMMSLSEAAQGRPGKVRLYHLRVTPGRLVAQAETQSFELANAFKDALSKDPRLREVAVSDMKSTASGMVSFNLSASIKEPS